MSQYPGNFQRNQYPPQQPTPQHQQYQQYGQQQYPQQQPYQQYQQSPQQRYPPQQHQQPYQQPYQQQPYQQPPQPQQPQLWFSNFYNQIGQNDLASLQAWFRTVDTDGSGTIEVNEIANMQFGGKPIGFANAKRLIAVFDRNYSGNLDFYEYASMHQFLLKMQAAFVTADADRSGYLDYREIHSALSGAGFQLTLPVVQAICQKYEDIPGRGLSLDSFLHACTHLARVRSIFDWNDKEKKGYIALTYDQLSHITIHLMDSKI